MTTTINSLFELRLEGVSDAMTRATGLSVSARGITASALGATDRRDESVTAGSVSRARTHGERINGAAALGTLALGSTELGATVLAARGPQGDLQVEEPTGVLGAGLRDERLADGELAISGLVPAYAPSMSILQPRDHHPVG